MAGITTIYDDGDPPRPIGTGLFVAPGRVLTAAHVIANIEKIALLTTELPEPVRSSPEVIGIRELAREVKQQYDELRESMADQAMRSARSGRRQFIFGVALGLPLGLLGSYIAYVLGWS